MNETENATEDQESETTVQSEPASAEANQTLAETITNQKATIQIEGQEFEIEAALAQDDKVLKTVLQPHFAAMENANITRNVKDGKLIVQIVKRAQHKG